jgi:hypothetical protein
MTGTARDFREPIEYSEEERRRRLGQVYSLLLDAARQKRAREAQQAAVSQDTLAGGDAMA